MSLKVKDWGIYQSLLWFIPHSQYEVIGASTWPVYLSSIVWPCIQRVKRIIPKLIQVVACVITDLSWKLYQNPLIHFTVMLLTDTPTRLYGRQSNRLANYSLCRAWHFLGISWKSLLRFSITLLRNKDPENRKEDPEKGLNATSRKCTRLLLASCPTFAENIMKIRSSVFP